MNKTLLFGNSDVLFKDVYLDFYVKGLSKAHAFKLISVGDNFIYSISFSFHRHIFNTAYVKFYKSNDEYWGFSDLVDTSLWNNYMFVFIEE